ncbi:calcium homeostasis modulator protein 2-like [Sorex fumeus]|uniref:calcium homeostasis modulator protein 2-like n=1 Tax=Sorex fumeus TaxID=62283 RepID=UPI0024AE2076|nr:calcium homeostasis modulator protein 2-like [Sorex fumeus]
MANPSVRFLSFLFKSNDLVSLNGLVALVTTSGQELFSLFAFHCPCTPGLNFQYGLMTIGGPALVFFFISIILNNQTRNLVAEWRCHKTKKCSIITTFLLLKSILVRALVAPVTWLVISLLRGEAYVCTFSEFVDPSSLMAGEESFPLSHATWVLARFPCREGPANLSDFREEVSRRLNYESQMQNLQMQSQRAVGAEGQPHPSRFGPPQLTLSLTGRLLLLLIKFFQSCCSKFGYRQEDYVARYLANEEQLFQRTAEVRSLAMAAKNVKRFFGFVALNKEDEELVAKFPAKGTHLKLQWDKITGSYLFQEKLGIPLYSRLHEWAQGPRGKASVIDKEMVALLPHPEPKLSASQTPNPSSPILPPATLALGEV